MGSMKIIDNYMFRVSFLVGMCMYCTLDASTLVYNMKIRRIFNVARHLLKEHSPLWVGSAVPIIQVRDRHIVDQRIAADLRDKSTIGGSLFNVRYVPSECWWVEATTGLEKETVCEHGTTNVHACRVGLDDIVLESGYNMFPSDDAQITFYGLAGFPTKKHVTVQETFNTLVGTRFYSIGVGGEYSYSFINTQECTLTGICQVRFIHFFPRCWFPILPRDAQIQPGNATDVLLTGQYRYDGTNIDVGYNPTIFTDQAVRLKTGTVNSPHFVRHSVYGAVTHAWKDFPGLHIPLALGTGLSIGRSEKFDTKLITWWVSFTTLF